MNSTIGHYLDFLGCEKSVRNPGFVQVANGAPAIFAFGGRGVWSVRAFIHLSLSLTLSDRCRSMRYLPALRHFTHSKFSEFLNGDDGRGRSPGGEYRTVPKNSTDWGVKLRKRFCCMCAESFTGSLAELQLPCNMLQNLFHNVPPHTVVITD